MREWIARFAVAAAVSASCLLGCGDEGELDDDDGVYTGEQVVGRMRDAGLDAGRIGTRNAEALDAAVATARDASLPAAGPCSDLFDANVLRTYEVQLTDAELQKITQEFLRPVVNADGSGYLHPYHPATLKLGSETREIMIRLKGDSSWLETVRRDRNPKAQFVIAFDRKDKAARFHGVDKLELDMPRTDPTYIRERVGNQVMRDLGLAGVCTASARLSLNGKYYGLYVAMEDMGKEALRRIYPAAPKAALWKEGHELETSATPEETARQQEWEKATDIAKMLPIIDLDQAIYEWAAEIAINNADGYYGGDHNFYTYDYPGRGFLWIPTDLDSAFDYLPATTNPIYWWESHDGDQTAGVHYRAVINDPVWRAKLVEAVGRVLTRMNTPRLQALVDAWAAQVATSIRDDPHRPGTVAASTQSTGWLRETLQQRADYLRTWLQCERTNTGTDADRDGSPWCKDCNDRLARVRPGAREVCRNGRDDDCDGLKDEGCLGVPAR